MVQSGRIGNSQQDPNTVYMGFHRSVVEDKTTLIAWTNSGSAKKDEEGHVFLGGLLAPDSTYSQGPKENNHSTKFFAADSPKHTVFVKLQHHPGEISD